MTPEQIDRVFGRGRLQMATGEHVEVFREAVAPGERRRYTKRFLATRDGDFGPWTEREWRILARLIGHGIRCVPDVVQFDGGVKGGMRLVQTYDAGVTVDQWGTLLPVARNSATHRHIFEDCAHWWALAHYCLAALNDIHALELVHLDIKADNICIPYGPADLDPDSFEPRVYPIFSRLALIDFAFSLVSREHLATPLPIGWEKDYDYQSPRLLKALEAGRNGDLEPTKELDWRCDFYSLAAMLRRYLPTDSRAHADDDETGWTPRRYDDARNLIFQLRDSHDRDLPHWRPHPQLIDFASARLDERDLAASLEQGWTFARDAIAAGIATPITPITPVTRIARSLRTRTTTPMTRIAPSQPAAAVLPTSGIGAFRPAVKRARVVSRDVAPIVDTTALQAARGHAAKHSLRAANALVLLLVALVAVAAPSFIGDPENPLADRARAAVGTLGTHLRVQWNSVLAKASEPAPNPARPGEQDRRSASAERSPTAAQESAVPAAPTDDQGAGVAPSTSSGASTAATSGPPQNPGATAAMPDGVQESTPTTSMHASDKAAVPSRPAEAPTTAARAPAVEKHNESRVALSTQSMPGDAMPSGTKAHTKADAPTNRTQTPKRSPPPPSATSGKRTRSAPTAIAGASNHSSPRQVLSQNAPVRSVPPPVRLAAATATSSSPPLSAQVPSMASGPGRAAIDSQGAPSSAIPNSPPATEPMIAANEDQRVTAPPAPSPPSSVETPPRDQRSAQPAAKQPRVTPLQQLNNDFHEMLDTVFGALRLRDRPSAPFEERGVQASSTSRPGTTARAPAQSAAARVAQAATAPRVQGNVTSRATSGAAAPTAAAPVPFGAPAPLIVEPFAEPTPAPAMALADRTAEPRAQARPATGAPPGVSLAELRTPVPMPSIPAPVQYVPADPAREAPANNGREAWLIQARRVLAETVPRVAVEAEPDVSRVLWVAARANQPYQIPTVVEAASVPWASEGAWIPVSNVAPSYARLLHNNARQAMASGGEVSDAVNLELQAFGANPRDADIAGYLAFLHLRMKPVQAEKARQLTLHAIALSGSRRSSRSDDWGRLAVASALTGRETDAVRAFLTEVALSSNLDRSCYSALNAYASFGERLRVPVQAMLSRVHSLGYAYPSCAWPSYWSVAARSPGTY